MKTFRKEYALAYDYLYHDKDYEKECDFIEEAFGKCKKKVKTILDLGCGTGGHALRMAKRGYKVTGIDRSEDMLAIARREAKRDNLTVELIKDNITNIELQQKFDAVIAMFAVMSYQTTNLELARVCQVAKKHLDSSGIFLFDCWYGPAVLANKPVMCKKEVKLDKLGKIIRVTEPALDVLSQTVETKFKLFKIQNGHLLNESQESHLMRYLFPQEVKYFLEVVGFSKIEVCPFLKLGESLTENDWNMAVIAIP